jgi:hypothetical protein
MNEEKQHKEKQINNYIANLDPENLNADLIKQELQKLIGEVPGIKFNYKSEEMLMEDEKSKKKIEFLESIDIIYTYDMGQGVPIPVTKNIIIN